eukprot:TRINITY_DN19037_c0_g1_i1.p1 TRINITY_DN19037_c0_g1~~TRINITY_DN19037_c0_g1_i1.p1  ORF type:complete len:109 (+),score=8.36 TRINITY_DN19037_c0_g1_i1:45-371(+)
MCVENYSWIWYRLDFFFQAEDGIRDLVRSRGLGDVYKRQVLSYYLNEAAFQVRLGFWVTVYDLAWHRDTFPDTYPSCTTKTCVHSDTSGMLDAQGRKGMRLASVEPTP